MSNTETTIHRVPFILAAVEQRLAERRVPGHEEIEPLLQPLTEALLLVRGYYDRAGNNHPLEWRVRVYAALCHAEDDVDHVLRAHVLEGNSVEAVARLPVALLAIRRAWDVLYR